MQAFLLSLCFFALIASLLGKSVEVGIYPRLTLVYDASVLLVTKLFVKISIEDAEFQSFLLLALIILGGVFEVFVF